MKKFIYIIFFISISTLSFSQVGDYVNDTLINYTDINNMKQGKWIKKHDNGVTRYKGQFLNNKPIGSFTYYYDTEDLRAIINHKENGTSNCEMYYENGEYMAEGKYDTNKEKIGKWKYYYIDGSLSSEIYYNNNYQLDSTCTFYYPSGSKLLVRNYTNGILNGDYIFYFDNNIIREKGTYKNNAKHGHFSYYKPSNKIHKSGEFINGKEEGPWYFYSRGLISDTIVYTRGVPDNQDEIDKQLDDKLEWAKENQDKFKKPEDYFNNPLEFFK